MLYLQGAVQSLTFQFPGLSNTLVQLKGKARLAKNVAWMHDLDN